MLDRIVARATAALIVTNEVFTYLNELASLVPTSQANNMNNKPVPKEAEGRGLWDAPCGALGHWRKIKDYKISHYQAVVPSRIGAHGTVKIVLAPVKPRSDQVLLGFLH